jgi:hypothetical protein
MKRPRLVAEVLELTRLPATTIEMSGDEGCRSLYSAFTRRHARWRLIQSHRWGVALMRVPDRYDAFFQDPDRSHLRREVNRAHRAGFTFAPIDGLARLDEILAINRSAEERQGRSMLPGYLDEGTMRRYFERSADVFGVTDAAGVLRAYLSLHTCGEIASLELVLGHADALRQGIMWPLFTGTIQELIRRRQAERRPTWFMYDMFSGASQGMRQFKCWIGFESYRVSWSWRD